MTNNIRRPLFICLFVLTLFPSVFSPYTTNALSRNEKCTSYLPDGGFEAGPDTTPWLVYSSSGTSLIVPEAARTGSYGARLGTSAPGTDQLGQYLSIPKTKTQLFLSFWWYMNTEERDHPWDTLEITFLPETGEREIPIIKLDDGEVQGAWVHTRVPVAAIAGSPGWLLMRSTNDEVSLTTWYIDDMSLSSCTMTTLYLPNVIIP